MEAARRQIEKARSVAVSANDIPALSQVLDLARAGGRSAHRKLKASYDDLTYSALQNLRFATRSEALAQGVPWRDPAAIAPSTSRIERGVATEVVTCPSCGSKVPSDEVRCRCGYNLALPHSHRI